MKTEEWVDENGYQRRSLLRDNDPDTAMSVGIPAGPPDLDRLDWEDVRRVLHNELFVRKLFTYEDVMRQQNALSGAILAALKRRLIGLYRDAGGI